MLQSLSIKNYAIIESLELDFANELTIITGETGAGKSILVGALSLILGERADTKVLYAKNQKCVVEGIFILDKKMKLINDPFRLFFVKHNLDQDSTTIIRREINPVLKSRAFINDTPVNLSVLKEFGSLIMDIHAQHESLELNSSLYHLSVIDAFAKQNLLLQKYTDLFHIYDAGMHALKEMKIRNQENLADQDYLSFQFEELDHAALNADEQDSLEDEMRTLNNAEEIKQKLQQANHTLIEGEGALYDQMASLVQDIGSVAKYHAGLEKIMDRLKSNLIEVKDVSGELNSIEQAIIYDPERLEVVNDRLELLYRLLKKHQCKLITELIQKQDALKKKLDLQSNLDEEIIKKEKELVELHGTLLTLANDLSKSRKMQLPVFIGAVNNLLVDVGMHYARIEVEHEILHDDQLNEHGRDRIQFMFSPDKGKNYMDINQIASGGELSRLMLCIKSLIAGSLNLPTILFDEIDSGISGEVAIRVGKILEDLSHIHQIICITHSQHLASRGQLHYLVFKEADEDKVTTRVRSLESEERIVEIAKMIGGDEPSGAALDNAKELLTHH